MAAPDKAAVLSDFDGTLAPIVDVPDDARPLPGAAGLLARLGRRYAAVGVISGRPASYLLEHIGALQGVVLVGLYGLERVEDGAVVVHPEAVAWRSVVEDAAARAEREAPPGVRVERKGLALGLHVRQAPELAPWVERFAAEQSADGGLEAHNGKLAVELRPPVRADKGTVVAELARGLAAVCYLGDDRGDLPAFAELARRRGEGATTLAVAVDSPEVPPALIEAADVTVDGPPGALALLGLLDAGP